MTAHAFADDGPGLYVEGGEQGRYSVPGAVVGARHWPGP